MEKRVKEGRKDADKTKAELLAELKSSRGQVSRLKDIVRRYERVAYRRDVYRSLYSLEVKRDSVESLLAGLREKQMEVDLRGEELEVLGEELRVQLEEASTKDDVITMQALMLAGVSDAVIGLDMDYRIIYWSASAEKMYGYTAEAVMGRSSLRVFKPEYLGSERETSDEVTIILTEAVHSTKDGCRIIVESRTQPLCGRDGKPYGSICINRDITERKRAEDALRDSEGRLRMAQQAALIGTFEWNIQTGVNIWTPELEAIYGLPTGGFRGTQPAWEQLVYQEDRAAAIRCVSEAIEKGEFEGEWRVVRPDDTIRWLYGRGFVFKDDVGEPLKLIGINMDITERKQTENALRESREQLKAVFKSIVEGVVIADSQGNLLDFNDTAIKIHGYEYESEWRVHFSETQKTFDLCYLDGEPMPFEVWPMSRVLNGETFKNYEVAVHRKDTELKAIWSFGGTPIVDEDGSIVLAIVTMHDITKRKRDEEALQESKGRLASDLAAMTSLQKISTRFVLEGDISSLLNEIMGAAVEIAGTDKGTLQLIKPGSDRLDIVAQRGFEPYFLDFFSSVSHGSAAVCDPAFQQGRRAIVEDVETSSTFVSTPALDVQRKAGVRAVQSTPIVNRRGETIGMLSTHWSNPCRPDDNVLRYMGLLAGQAADIIDHKRTEEALRLTSYSLDKAREIVVWFRPDGSIYYANDVACESFGYSRDEMLLRTIFDINPNYTRTQWNDRFQELKSKGSTSYEIENLAKDGRWFPIDVTNTHIKYGDNEFMVGYARDITERKNAEEALRDSEEHQAYLLKLSDALRPLSDAHSIQDAATRLLADHLGASQSSYTEYLEEYSAVSHESLNDPTISTAGSYKLSDFPATMDILYSGRDMVIPDIAVFPPFSEEEKEHYLARNIHANATVPIIKDGRLVSTISVRQTTPRQWTPEEVGLVRETAERTWSAIVRARAEEGRDRLLREVGEERARLQAILDSLPVGVWIVDAAGKMVVVNNYARVIWGGEAPVTDDVSGYSVYKAWRTDTGEVIEAEDMPLAQALAYGRAVKDRVIDFERFDGTRGTQLASAAPIRGFDGDIIGSVCIVQDITRLKQTEEDLKQAKQQAELYLDLMGHDLNNMHQIVLGYLELAQFAPPGVQQDKEIMRSVEVLHRSAQLISNVQKLQKLNDSLHMYEVDICSVLRRVQRESGLASDKSIMLNLDNLHCPVRADELLYDVFSNLVGNAVKHAGDHADINISLDIVNDNGRCYRVSVEDDGPGIPDDFKLRIFNRMLKGTNKAKGMGLGLYLVKTLVDSYNGRVWVEDRVPGDHTKGAKFVVTLPAINE